MTASKCFVCRFADVEFRAREFSPIKADKVLTVEPKAFRALLFLLRNPQKLISKEELLNSVWGDAAVTQGSLTRCIWLLRSLLGDDPRNPRYIETVATVGYRFVCKVEVAEDNSASLEGAGEQNGQGSRDSGETLSGKLKVGSRGRQLAWLLSGAAVLAAGLASLAWYLLRPLPPPRISGYSQITHDGHRNYIAGTDGSRLYFNFMSPISTAQVAISGGKTASNPVAVPGFIPSFLGVSPDGSSFLIESIEAENDTLWNVLTLGGSYRRLGNGTSRTFSPDGNSVAYVTLEGDLWIVKSDGTGAHKLASVGYKPGELTWSPKGETIRFTQGDRLWEIDSSGSKLHQLLPNWRVSPVQCCGRWTPDGKFFLFLSAESSSQSSEIWVIDERRGLVRRPLPDPVQLTNGPMRWDSLIAGKDGKGGFCGGNKSPWGACPFRPQDQTATALPWGHFRRFCFLSRRRQICGLCLLPGGHPLESQQRRKQPRAVERPAHASKLAPLVPRWRSNTVRRLVVVLGEELYRLCARRSRSAEASSRGPWCGVRPKLVARRA